MYNQIIVVDELALKMLGNINITIPSFVGKSDYIRSYFTSKYQIPRELQHWRNLVQSESVDDETMIFKSTTTFHQIKAEQQLGIDLQKKL